ncbi:MAG TPA: glycosyltransferase family 41 protein [Crenotrichaceae bacterium]|nr:glycosyltransferase family 41 protein [Crenotrichaceae bacterium]
MFREANLHFQQGRLAEAEALIRRVLSHNPRHADASFLLGLIAGKCGHFDVSASLITQAIQFNPHNPAYYINLGLSLYNGGQFEQAVAAYKQAIKIKPRFVDALYRLGEVLEEMGRFDDALSAYDRAIKFQPQNVSIHKSRAFLLWALGRGEESLKVCKRVTMLAPSDSGGHYNLGKALSGLGHLVDAAAAFEHAIKIKPDYAEAYSELGAVFKDMCRLDDAEKCNRRAIELMPTNTIAHSNLLFLLSARLKISPDEMLKELRHWDDVHGREGRQHRLPLRVDDTTPGRRLKIGYVSPDFRVHAVSSFFEPVLQAHDKRRFEIFCYATHDETASDATTERLQKLSEHWHFVSRENDFELAQLIHNDGIDILVDMAGHTGGNSLKTFSYRPAPVQTAYLGYFASTGLDVMDYWISDEMAHPVDTDEPAVECIYRLPRCSLCYLPSDKAPPVSPCPSTTDQVTFCSVSDISKLTPEVIETWSQILHVLPGSQLLMTTKSLSEPENRQMMAARFEDYDITGDQLRMHSTLSHKEWLANYAQVDIILDPFPRTGTTTTAEALWMGVPVVTLAGKRYVSRASATVIHAVGLDELIADSKESYINKAVSLAHDPELRARLRADQREMMAESPLRDGKSLAQSMESAYRAMWEAYQFKEKSD